MSYIYKKQNEIPFLDEIPCEWQLIPNKYLFVYDGEKVGENYANYVLLSLTTSGVKEKDINSAGGKVPTSYENYQTVKSGQMVFCLFDLDCSAVFAGISNYNGMITSAYDVFSSTGLMLNEYGDYWFKYVFSNRYYKIYSKNIRYTVTSDMFKSIKTPVPPISEQIKISEFLLDKEKKIDGLIANQQAQIEKLKQYKQSVITEAVTRGLNPSAPLKASGIDWIGSIPEHWEVVKIGSLFICRNEKVNDTDYPPLSVSKGGIVPQIETVAKSDANDNRKLVLKDDFVINSRSDRKQSCGLSQLDGSVSLINTVLTISNKNILLPKYTNYLLKNYCFAEEFYRWGHGIVADLWTTRWQEMKSIALPIPSLEEQQQIADYLDNKCGEIDRLISLKQQKIDALTSYKKSLIYEYVTGKKEVV